MAFEVTLSDDEKGKIRREIARAEVKEKIKDLYYIRRWPLIDVMKELRIDASAMAKYMDDIYKDFIGKGQDNLKREIAMNLYQSYRGVLFECWNIVEQSKNDYVKLKALELIQEIEMKNVDALQKLGIIEKPVEKHEVTHKHDFNDMLEKWREIRKKEKVIDVKVEDVVKDDL